jgi:hypothetical protein
MENLNAEQVMSKLGQLAMADCLTGKTIKGCSTRILVIDAIALINSQEQRIKELAEENERLRLKDAENAESAFRDTAVILGLQQRLKKTTEENERWKKRSVVLLGEDGSFQVINLTEERLGHPDPVGEPGECGLSRKCKADTVRKMQERIKQYIDVGHYRSPTEICFSELDVANIIDRIAKEMLEGIENE